LKGLDRVLSVQSRGQNLFVIETEPDAHLQEEVARLALDQQWGIEELKPMDMTLEDIFLQLTTEEKDVREVEV